MEMVANAYTAKTIQNGITARQGQYWAIGMAGGRKSRSSGGQDCDRGWRQKNGEAAEDSTVIGSDGRENGGYDRPTKGQANMDMEK